MSPDEALRRYRAVAMQRNVSVLLILLLVIAVTALSLRVLSGTSKTVLLPTNIMDGMVAEGRVDIAYIEAIALDAAQAMFTVHETSLRRGRHVLERVAHPKKRAELLTFFDEQAKEIKDRKISTVFEATMITTDLPNLRVLIDGWKTTEIANLQVARVERQVVVTFDRQAGSVRVSSIDINEDNND